MPSITTVLGQLGSSLVQQPPRRLTLFGSVWTPAEACAPCEASPCVTLAVRRTERLQERGNLQSVGEAGG